MRRAFELVCTLIGLVVLWPIFLVVAVAIKLEDGGPVFYAHPRVGRNFRRFRLLKFRSMVSGADRRGGAVTSKGDPRITKVGRVLRKYKLDELPQLLNVLKGEISLVGARPEVERYVNLFRPQYEEILAERPGITDPATLAFRNEEELFTGDDVEGLYLEEILPRKLELSLEYGRRRTFFSDLVILFRTVLKLPSGREKPEKPENLTLPRGPRVTR